MTNLYIFVYNTYFYFYLLFVQLRNCRGLNKATIYFILTTTVDKFSVGCICKAGRASNRLLVRCKLLVRPVTKTSMIYTF